MRSNHSAFHRFSYAVIPTIITVFFIIFSNLNFQVEGLAQVMPFFAATALYYWRLHNPSRMRKLVIFGIGLVQDTIYGTTLGATSLILLLFLVCVKTQRESVAGRPFWVCWLVFVPNIAIFSALTWMIHSLLIMKFEWDNLLLVQWVVSVMCYPLLHQIFSLIDRQENV